MAGEKVTKAADVLRQLSALAEEAGWVWVVDPLPNGMFSAWIFTRGLFRGARARVELRAARRTPHAAARAILRRLEELGLTREQMRRMNAWRVVKE